MHSLLQAVLCRVWTRYICIAALFLLFGIIEILKESPAKLISILITDDSVQTKEGLYIGQTRENVEKLYGKKKKKENEYIYKKGKMELSIIFEGDKVISIEYRG